MQSKLRAFVGPIARVIRLAAETMAHHAAIQGSPEAYAMQFFGL